MSKILLVYASKTGVTQDAAMELAKFLSIPCDIYNCRDELLYREGLIGVGLKPSELKWSSYEIIVIGTAMYMGSPMKEVKSFCKKYQEQLIQKRLICFTCGIGTETEDKAYLWKHLPKEVSRSILLYRHLGGEIREERLNGFSRFAMREYGKQHGLATGINYAMIKKFSDEIIN